MGRQIDKGLKEWNIWIEGYVCSGQSGGAMIFGSAKAYTFQEAVEKLYHAMLPEEQKFFNKEKTHYWACRLFDNETDARKNFG